MCSGTKSWGLEEVNMCRALMNGIGNTIKELKGPRLSVPASQGRAHCCPCRGLFCYKMSS